MLKRIVAFFKRHDDAAPDDGWDLFPIADDELDHYLYEVIGGKIVLF